MKVFFEIVLFIYFNKCKYECVIIMRVRFISICKLYLNNKKNDILYILFITYQAYIYKIMNKCIFVLHFWTLIIINTYIIMKCVVINYQLCIFFCLVWCSKNYINYKKFTDISWQTMKTVSIAIKICQIDEFTNCHWQFNQKIFCQYKFLKIFTTEIIIDTNITEKKKTVKIKTII